MLSILSILFYFFLVSNILLIMSVASSTRSTASVSFYGDEIEFEKAIDQTFLDCQEHLNQLHVEVRNLSMCDVDDHQVYMEALKAFHAVLDNIDGLAVVFKELKSVAKQALGPAPKALKEEVKQEVERWKERRKREKEEAKREVEAAKAATKAAKEEEKKGN